MKHLYNFIISKIKIIIGLILILAILYIVFIVLANSQELNYLKAIKDILGGVSFALSLSLALSLNINVASYKAEQQYFVQGDLHQHNADQVISLEAAEKNEVLKTVNKIANDTQTLASILSLEDMKKPMGFIPLNAQRDVIYNQRKFIAHIEGLKNKLSDGLLTIKDNDFVTIVNECISICDEIKTEYNKLYNASQSPMLNQINSLRTSTVDNLKSLVLKIKEKNSELRNKS